METLKSSSSAIEIGVEQPPSPASLERRRSAVMRWLSPILTGFHAGYFRISLSLGWQAMLWKTLQRNHPMNNHVVVFHVVQIMFWSFGFLVLMILSVLYFLRCLFCFSLVKREFLHHIDVNYLFAPWISWLLLLQSVPFHAPAHVLLWFFAVPVVALDVKIYGQWFTKGKRILTTVANPTSQLTVISNLVVARAAAMIGWQEVSICLFSLGMIHYLVLFVTLYQRFPGSDRLPAMLRPVFFLFFAAPTEASLAWDSISGIFDTCSKMLFFLSLFLFTSLICRPRLFKKSMRRFNVAIWAYSYTITLLALAAVKYAKAVNGVMPKALMFILSALSVLVFLFILFITIFNLLQNASNGHFHKSLKKIQRIVRKPSIVAQLSSNLNQEAQVC